MTRPLLASLAVLAALALPSPVAAQEPLPEKPDGPQAYLGLRVVGPNPKLEPRTRPVDYAGEPLQLRWNAIGDRAVEPTMGIDKQGTLFYAGRGNRNAAGVRGTKVFRSRDDGRSWERIDMFAPAGEDPPPDLDPWVYVEPDSGRVFEIALLLANSFLAFSDDQGDSWETSQVESPGVNDHQAFSAGPPPAANPTLVPTDPAFPKIAYYCVNHVSDARCTASRDGGKNFLPTGGPAFAACGTALHGHLATDAEGRLFLPTGSCNGRPTLAISENGGATWTQVTVAPDISAAVNHTEVAVDTAGNLYYVWHDLEHRLPYLATSTDHGQTWSAPLMIAPPTVHESNFPTVVAGEAGRVAVTFPGTTVDVPADQKDPTRPWNQYVVVSTNALDAEPLFLSNIANPKGDPVHRGDCLGRCGGLLDFLDIQLSPFDGAVWAAVVDGCTTQERCSTERAAGTAVDNQGGAVKQVGGPRLVGPLPSAAGFTPGPQPAPGGPASAPDTAAPTIGNLKLSPRKIRAGRRSVRRGRLPRTRARVRFVLSEGATLTATLRRDRRHAGAWRVSGAAGANSLALTDRMLRRRGRYTLTLVAVDAAGNRSRAARVRFRVR